MELSFGDIGDERRDGRMQGHGRVLSGRRERAVHAGRRHGVDERAVSPSRSKVAASEVVAVERHLAVDTTDARRDVTHEADRSSDSLLRSTNWVRGRRQAEERSRRQVPSRTAMSAVEDLRRPGTTDSDQRVGLGGLLQELAGGVVGQHLAAGLAGGAVRHRVAAVADRADRVAAHRARFARAAVHGSPGRSADELMSVRVRS